jgi:hypothetical protein
MRVQMGFLSFLATFASANTRIVGFPEYPGLNPFAVHVGSCLF